VQGKNKPGLHDNFLGTNAPKHTGAETTYPHGLGTRTFWGTRATNFFIYTTKMEGAGPQILGIGAKFKQVQWQKSCPVNQATVVGSLGFYKAI